MQPRLKAKRPKAGTPKFAKKVGRSHRVKPRKAKRKPAPLPFERPFVRLTEGRDSVVCQDGRRSGVGRALGVPVRSLLVSVGHVQHSLVGSGTSSYL